MKDEDHDTLIEVRTIVKKIDEWTIKHTADDAVAQKDLEKTVKAAHTRIDGLFVSGVLAIVFMVIGFVFTKWGGK